MPVKLATIGRQRTVAGLAKSIFGLKNEPELQARAEAALIRANPQLAEDGRLTAGATIVVPDVPGLRPGDDVRRAALRPSPVDGLDPERLDRLAKVVAKLPEIAVKGGEAARAELKARDFLAVLAKAHPDLRQQLPEIANAVAADAELMVKRAQQLGEAIKLIQADQARQKTRAGLV